MTDLFVIEKPVEVETFVWMQVVNDEHTNKKYYSIGRVKEIPNTLLVTEVGSNGGAIFYCQKHKTAYPFRHHCTACLEAVVDTADDASVTGCDTPENQHSLEGR